MTKDDFYIVAYEAGAENPALPTWACRSFNPAGLLEGISDNAVQRVDLPAVPGAFQLLNVLAREECVRLIALSESLGYHQDAAVSLPRTVRHNDNVVWVTDEKTDTIIWQRVASQAMQNPHFFDDRKPLGLNARFRFYRYGPGDYFKPHTDGAWPGSRVIDGKLIANAYPDRYSQMTFLIFLNDDFGGGATRFFVPDEAEGRRYCTVDIRTSASGVLCFPHGMHPLHCLHSSEPIERGVKYIIRTDMLFEL